MTDRKLHVNTLILIPTLKIYMFWYSRQTDRQTDRWTDGWRNYTGVGHPHQGTYVSPPHVTTSYSTWGGAVGP
jgi:hypothetical protein